MDSQPNSASLDQLQDIQTSLANDIIFVDTGLADYQTLVHGLPDGAQVVLLDAHQDGLIQMAAYLEGKSGINAIHVLSHGAAGRLRLGGLTLDAASLDTHAAELAAIGRGLAQDGDILLYGCNVAAGATGVEFIGKLAQATGADVAASDDLTGATGKGGDWVLENHAGQITVQPLFSELYNTILAPPVSENFDGVTLTEGPDGKYSFGNLGEARTINGWTFSVINPSGWLATGCQIDVTNNTADTNLVDGNNDKAAFFSGTETDADALSLKSASSDSFSFQSLYVQWGLSATADYRLVGYLDNSPVALATQEFTAPEHGSPGLKVEVSGSQWNNIDEIRIFILGGTDDASLYIDDIVVSAPPDTTPPTLDGASSTPVDNATGVAVDANLVIDFSENIAFGSSGTITVRNVTTNSTAGTFAVSGGSASGAFGTATISGDKLTIDPTNNLAGNTQYSVQFSTGSIVDTASTPNQLAAINDDTTYNFTTANATPFSRDITSFLTLGASSGAQTAAGMVATTAIDSITLEAWVYLDNTTGAHHLLFNGNGGNSGYGLYISGGTINVLMGSVGWIVCSTGGSYNSANASVLQAGEWTHVVATRNSADGGTDGWKMYVNGQALATQFNAAGGANGTPRAMDGSSYIQIGSSAYDPSGLSVSEARIWTKALTQAEIQANMAGNVATNAENLVGYWKLAQTSGTTFNDVRTNGTQHDLTGTGTITWTASTSGTTNEDTALSGILSGGDLETDVTYAVTQPSHGAVSVNAATGAYTYTPSANYNGSDSFTFTVNDGAVTSAPRTVNLAVTAMNDAPVITSNGGDATAAVSVAENTTAVATVQATDVDGDAITYSITGGTDQAKFDITDNSGLNASLFFKAAPDFETPTDSGTNNTYEVIVQADDGKGGTDTQTITVTVTNVDEAAPAITSGATAMAIDENSGAGQVVYTATSTDTGDIATGSTTYSLKAIGDHASFSINGATGAVTLTGNPDHETKPNYAFTVVATDAAGNASEQPVTLAVNDLDEVAPTITSGATATAIDENSGAGQVVYTATSTDTGDIATGSTTYSLKAVGDHAAFSIDAASGAVTLTGTPDYETKDSYAFTVIATDAAGNASEQAVTLAVNDVNEAPVITSGDTGTVAENAPINTVIYDADASDPDAGQTLTYTLTGTDAALLDIDTGTGEVTLQSPADFETKNSYSFNVVATDNGTGNLTGSKAVTVSVTDVDETPTISSAIYDAATGVLTVTGTYIEANGGGADIDASRFTLTGEGGETYTLTDTPDAERDSVNQFTLNLSASDRAAVNQIINRIGISSTGGTPFNLAAADDWCTNVTAGDTSDATNTVPVINVFAPAITSATYNSVTGELVVTGTSFVRFNGAANDIDVSMLSVTGTGGSHTLTSLSDVEITSPTSFTVTLTGADKTQVDARLDQTGTQSSDSTTYNLAAAEDWARGADVAVNIVDTAGNGITVTTNTAPVITSNLGGATAAVSLPENTTAVTTVQATDVDAGQTIDYSITGGADAAKFDIVGATGVLTFKAAPDFETKTDADANNSYIVEVTADDGNGGTDTQTITVTVTDVNEAPTVTSGETGTVAENAPISTVIYTATATDPDAGQTLTYTLTGADAALLDINASTGAVTLKNPADFETKNAYGFNVVVTDNGAGNLTDAQAVTVNVTDVNETSGPPLPDPDPNPQPDPDPNPQPDPDPNPQPDPDPNPQPDPDPNPQPDPDPNPQPDPDPNPQPDPDPNPQPDPDPNPQPDPDPNPQPGPGMPPEDTWDDLPDDDGDGIPEIVENFVPGVDDGAQGDGNGDGVQDTSQPNVSSVPFRDTSHVSQEPDAEQVFVTLTATASAQNALRNVHQQDAPDDLPEGVDMPLGLIAFEADVAVGVTETFSLFVEAKDAFNGYFKQNSAGDWVNIATAITVDEKVRIDFAITDGGEFDADGIANGVIVDPGATGFASGTPSQTLSEVLGVVATLFDATPGAVHLDGFLDSLSASYGLRELTRDLLQTNVFQGILGNQPGNSQFTSLALQHLGLEDNARAIDYFATRLNRGDLKENIILEAVQYLLGDEVLPSVQSAADFMRDKIIVSQYASNILALCDTDLDPLQKVLANMDTDSISERIGDLGQNAIVTTLSSARPKASGTSGQEDVLHFDLELALGASTGCTLSFEDFIAEEDRVVIDIAAGGTGPITVTVDEANNHLSADFGPNAAGSPCTLTLIGVTDVESIEVVFI